jgi:hypothetical protein
VAIEGVRSACVLHDLVDKPFRASEGPSAALSVNKGR